MRSAARPNSARRLSVAEPTAGYLSRPAIVADASVVAAALRAYTRVPIERHAVDAEVLVALAERYGLTTYDAAYLSVAAQLAAPLATFDDQLATAARLHLGARDEVHEPGRPS